MSRYPGTVYLLHFAEPIGNPERPRRAGMAQHYIGHAERGRLLERVAEQLAGGAHAAAIMRHLKRAGISAELARVWEGDKKEERRIKNRGGASRSCPMCGVRPTSRRPGQKPPRPRARAPWWPEPGAPSRSLALAEAAALEYSLAPPF